MFKITAPNKQYTGSSAGIPFSNGVGYTDDERLLNWFKKRGYMVEENQETETVSYDEYLMLKTTHEELINHHDELMDCHEDLKKSYRDLTNYHEELENAHKELQALYDDAVKQLVPEQESTPKAEETPKAEKQAKNK